MGVKAATIKMGFQTHKGYQRHSDDPYSHLAASIIIQALDDLKALDGLESRELTDQNVDRWEIINFFRSEWCGFLLGFQENISHEKLQSVAMALISK